MAIKARVKVRVRTKKVDRTRSPPFRLVLGRIFNLLLCFFASLTCSRHRSPPFRTVRGLSTLLCSLFVHAMSQLFDLFHLGGTAPSPALHHLGWPWLPLWVLSVFSKSSSAPLMLAWLCFSPSSSPPLRLALVWGFFFSSFPPSSPLLAPLWPPRPLESKVIQIQSDHLLAASPPVAAMERSKVTKFVEES